MYAVFLGVEKKFIDLLKEKLEDLFPSIFLFTRNLCPVLAFPFTIKLLVIKLDFSELLLEFVWTAFYERFRGVNRISLLMVVEMVFLDFHER